MEIQENPFFPENFVCQLRTLNNRPSPPTIRTESQSTLYTNNQAPRYIFQMYSVPF